MADTATAASEDSRNFVLLTHEPLNISECLDLVKSPTAGAISSFVGTTRDHFQGRRVLELSYEAYDKMAEQELRRLLESVCARWDVCKTAVQHRLGVVPVGEASVVIAISSCHRRESLEAVSYAIDTLKATVPIWKKEVYAEGDSSWKENKECTWSVSGSAIAHVEASG